MKTYKVERVRVVFGRNSTEKLRLKVETLINEKTREGYELVRTDFELADHSGYIYCFVIFSQ